MLLTKTLSCANATANQKLELKMKQQNENMKYHETIKAFNFSFHHADNFFDLWTDSRFQSL
jgi:chloramphenicol O-acetyltransferase